MICILKTWGLRALLAEGKVCSQSVFCFSSSFLKNIYLNVLGVSCNAQVFYCSARAYSPCNMWDPPRSGIQLMSPALAHGFLTTQPLDVLAVVLYWVLPV